MKRYSKFVALPLAGLLALGFPACALASSGDPATPTVTISVPEDKPKKERPKKGRTPSDPDGNSNGGADKPGGSGGFDDDKDFNNGCGNDADFEDDNNGNCGGKPKVTPSNTPTTIPSISPAPVESVEPSEVPVSPEPSEVPSVEPSEEPAPPVIGPVIPVVPVQPSAEPEVPVAKKKVPFVGPRTCGLNCPPEEEAPVVEEPALNPCAPVEEATPAKSVSPDTATATIDELPHTGIETTLLMLAGAGMVGLGYLLNRRGLRSA